MKRKLFDYLVFSWSTKIILIFCNVITARLLGPSDYGIFLVLQIPILLGDSLSFGVGPALIHLSKQDDKSLNLQWTYDYFFSKLFILIISFTLFQALFNYFNIAWEKFYLIILLAIFFKGLENSSVVKNTLELSFIKRCIPELSKALFWLISLVMLFLIFRDFTLYHAIISFLIGQLCRTISSYIIYPKIPKLVLRTELSRYLFKTGIWYALIGVAKSLRGQVDRYVIGLQFTSESLALFNNGGKLPVQLSQEITKTANNFLFPYMSFDEDKSNGIKKLINFSLFILIPVSLILMYYSKSIVSLIFGTEYMAGGIYLLILTPIVTFRSIYSIIDSNQKSRGIAKYDFLINLLNFIILLISSFFISSVLEFAYVIVLLEFMSALYLLYVGLIKSIINKITLILFIIVSVSLIILSWSLQL